MLDQGWSELRYANWPKAQEVLEAVQKKADNRQVKSEAMFALAVLWQIRQPSGNVEKAKILLKQIISEYADTSAAPWAYLAIARIADTPEYEKDRDLKEARRLYEETIRLFPNHPASDEAVLRLGFTYLEKIGDDASQNQGADILEKWIAAHPKSYLAPAMLILLGDRYERKADWRRAVDWWTRADEAGVPGLADRATLYYKLGQVCEKRLKDYPLAVKWYEKLVYDIKRDGKFFVSKLAAERCRKLAGMPPRDDIPELSSALAEAQQ
jgi:tetratricopeptide (TPR) repeat protein